MKFGLIRFGIKAGIMSSVVYVTVDKGVWKDSETTAELIESIQNTVTPYIPFEIPKMPEKGLISNLKTIWNKDIREVFQSLVNMPDTMKPYINKGTAYTYDKITQLKALYSTENGSPNETKI